jgi:hypothetical protein
MKPERAPVLNRFERELAAAIDARVASRRGRRRILVPAFAVVALLIAGVSYALVADDDGSTVQTQGPADSTATTVASEDSSQVLQADSWTLGIETGYAPDPLCVVLATVPERMGKASTCGRDASEFDTMLQRSPIVVLHLDDPQVLAGIASENIAALQFLDDRGNLVKSVATSDPVVSLHRWRFWALDRDVVRAATIHLMTTDGSDVPEVPVPRILSGAEQVVIDTITLVAKAAIVGDGTDDPDAYIDNPEGLAPIRTALANLHPEQIGNTQFVMHEVTLTSDTTADFVYDVLLAPPLADRSMHNLVGHAVVVDGQWKVTRATACQVWNFGNGTC